VSFIHVLYNGRRIFSNKKLIPGKHKNSERCRISELRRYETLRQG
jgi:hypothetical protein